MNFIKQTKLEFTNILRSKFLLIIGIRTIALGMVIPTVGYFMSNQNDNGNYYPMYSVAKEYVVNAATPIIDETYVGDSITVNGVTIYENSPVYWEIKVRMDEMEMLKADSSRFTAKGTLALYMELAQQEIDYYIEFAKVVKGYEDYRYQILYPFLTKLHQQYILSYNGSDTAAIAELAKEKLYLTDEEYAKQYVNISAAERKKTLEELEIYFEDIKEVLETNEFTPFVRLMITSQEDQIRDTKKQIELQEELIAKNPSLEESTSGYIEQMKAEIKNIEENVIPMWEYRLEKNIIPGTNSWQNMAIMSIEENNNNLVNNRVVPESEFKRQQWLIEQYKTYEKYVVAVEKERNKYQNEVVIAQRSLDSDLPDMKYVPDGARRATSDFLTYSIIAALYAILLGGWLIASEFQSGTIRLLLIRPKTRIKILLSKYLAGLVISALVYLLGVTVNILFNGIFKGFTDLGYPNFTVTSQIGFFADYLPKMLACFVTVFMGYCIAFMLSAVVKNTAVAAVIPIVLYVGCIIFLPTLAYTSQTPHWLAFTPIPYVNMASFLTNSYEITSLMQRGVALSLPVGLIMLSVIGVISVVISAVAFKKRDVAN